MDPGWEASGALHGGRAPLQDAAGPSSRRPPRGVGRCSCLEGFASYHCPTSLPHAGAPGGAFLRSPGTCGGTR